MKTRQLLICSILFIVALFSCTPEEQPPTISYVFSDVSVDEGQTFATITCRNESVDDDKVHASVLLSKNENITNATKYPLSLQNDTLRTTISGLEENTLYYFCFEVYTANEHKRTEEVHHFETKGGGSVTVTTSEAINITQTTVTGGGSVLADGNYTVSMRGVCWDTVPNPNALQSPHLVSGQGPGAFLVNITGLKSHTQYYMKAYAVCNDVMYYGNEVSFVTLQTNSYTINVSANPSEGGTATGGGTYNQGQSCTVIATAANGYRFSNWTEGGNEVSTNANYTFTVNDGRTLVANFSEQAPNTYTINASPNPSNGGTVTGNGSYEQGQSCTVQATANTGYMFLRWTENGEQVSTNANYTFTVIGNRTLVAQFQAQSYTITVSSNPTNGGSVSGGGNYNYGQSCTLTATTNSGYSFTNWTENGSVVSTNTNYTFTVTSNRALVANFTANPQNYTVSVSSNPSNGGSVTGGGTYQQGQNCTVSATANSGYSFANWTENGNVVSTNANYTFAVTTNRTLVANFIANPQNYTISVSANPSNGGNVSGGGTFQQGQSCTVQATTNTGFTFINWTENGNQVSTNAKYTFTVTSNRTLVAQFEAQVQAPIGAINGLFSVSATQQVWFSQGNLQYIGSASVPYWKFAENQWDYLGATTGQNSSDHNVDRDLFGWGTSGWYNGSTYYMPFDVEDAYPSYYQYGPSGEYDLTGEYANADWGVYNPISNGGNVAGQWRTLTNSEWGYVLFSRTTPSGIRFAKAVVNDVNGVIVLPDDWVGSIYALSSINNREANYNNNIISASNWNSILQSHGAVFLPASGSRAGTSVLYAGTNGYYWSTSYYNSYQSKAIFFSNTQLKTGEPDFRYYGRSVRLVQDH